MSGFAATTIFAAASAGFLFIRSVSMPACFALCATNSPTANTQITTNTRQPPSPPRIQTNGFVFLGGAGALTPGGGGTAGGTGGLVDMNSPSLTAYSSECRHAAGIRVRSLPGGRSQTRPRKGWRAGGADGQGFRDFGGVAGAQRRNCGQRVADESGVAGHGGGGKQPHGEYFVAAEGTG